MTYAAKFGVENKARRVIGIWLLGLGMLLSSGKEMRFMSNEEYIQELAENVLWDAVGDYVEQVEEFKKMVEVISYIDHDKVMEVTWCEVFDSEEIIVLDAMECEDKVVIHFEMPFMLSAWNEETQLFRVTACVQGKAELEQENVVMLEELEYTDVEVDSTYENWLEK